MVSTHPSSPANRRLMNYLSSSDRAGTFKSVNGRLIPLFFNNPPRITLHSTSNSFKVLTISNLNLPSANITGSPGFTHYGRVLNIVVIKSLVDFWSLLVLIINNLSLISSIPSSGSFPSFTHGPTASSIIFILFPPFFRTLFIVLILS